MPENYVIIIPQFNDWEALNLLIEKINADLDTPILQNTTLLIVDDCSSRLRTEPFAAFGGKELKVLRLYRNLGHQKAIAIGLSYAAEHMQTDKVIVMDADGEDAPADINKLAARSIEEPGKIIFAERNKRTEGILFRSFYVIYKYIFSIQPRQQQHTPFLWIEPRELNLVECFSDRFQSKPQL